MTMTDISATRPHLLRHIVLATPDVDKVAADLFKFLEIADGHRLDMGEILGFRNVMLMVGTTMVELVQPTKPDHRLHRWLAENGGEGGYMLVLQTFDADAFRARAEAEQLRLTRDMLFRGQDMIQFDPKRFGTHLETYRYSLPNGWWGDPVGRKYEQSPVAAELAVAEVAVKDPPAEIAAQVGRLFESKVSGTTVSFVDKKVHFVAATGHPGLKGVDLKARARSARGREAQIGGMRWRLV
jgi:hypothetical protein